MSNTNQSSPQKVLDERSLRKKMSAGFVQLQYNKRDETKIILIEGENITPQPNIPILKYDFEKEIRNWNFSHRIDDANSLEIDKKYHEIVAKLFNHLESTNSDNLNLKSLISDSDARTNILSLPRPVRQKIYKRLEHLLIKGSPILEIFNDERVRKIIISETVRVQFIKESLEEKRISIFKSKAECQLFKKALSLISDNGSNHSAKVLNSLSQNIVIKKCGRDPINQTYTLKRIRVKSPSLLELMREGTLTIEGGNLLIKQLKNNSSGIMICGGSTTGKTRALLALLSTLANSRFPAITADIIEFKNTVKDFNHISRQHLNETIKNGELDYLADSIASSAINLYIAEDCTGNELALAWLLFSKHNIPSIVSFNGCNCLNSLLHLSNSAIHILNYSAERSYFFWNLARTFPILLDLNNVVLNQGEILQKISFNNDILSLKNLELDSIRSQEIIPKI